MYLPEVYLSNTRCSVSLQSENVRFVQSRNVRFSKGRGARWKRSGSSWDNASEIG